MIIPVSYAYTFFVGDCDDTGSIRIYSTQNIDGEVYASKDRKTWFNVPGQWSDDLKFFDSEDMILNDNFKYGFIINYQNFKYSFDAYCPGYKFSCKELNLSIDNCYQRPGYFYAEFKALNHNGIYDLRYSFETDKDDVYTYSPLSKSTTLKHLTINNLGDGNYLLKLKTDLNIEKFSISHDKCYNKNDRYYTYVEKYCNRFFCVSDSNCSINEFCDKSNFLCKELDCSICETPFNHSCVEKCDDNNLCTTNECAEGECKFTVMNGCPSENQCLPYNSVDVINNVSSYCGIENEWIPQKKDGESCENDYECINECAEGVCAQSTQNKGFFQAIFDFFAGLFSF